MPFFSDKSKKQRIVNAAYKKYKSKQVTKSPLFKSFINCFYNASPLHDIQDWNDEVLMNAAHSLFALAGKRKSKEHKVRVFNPDVKKDGWTINHTVVEIVTENVPFVVDSVTAELNRRGFLVHFITHPMMVVKRGRGKKLEEIKEFTPKSDRKQSESFVHIQLNRQLAPSTLKTLEKDIIAILDDVMAATSDWKMMLSTMRESIENLETIAPDLVKKSKIEASEMDETLRFLDYLVDNHFTFLGVREYSFDKSGKTKIIEDSGMGILRGKDVAVFDGYRTLKSLPPEVLKFRKQKTAMALRKTSQKSKIHRDVPMDVIIIKKYDTKGNVVGEQVFVGLFTSTVYAQSVQLVPYIRKKVDQILDGSGFAEQTHDYKALLDILEKYPRDEMFQSSVDDILDTSLLILELKERQRVAVFARKDDFERSAMFMVYIPRDKFNLYLRQKVQTLLEETLNGHCEDFYTTLDDSPLARVIFVIRANNGKIETFDTRKLEKTITEFSRSWHDKLRLALIDQFGTEEGAELGKKYKTAFSDSYSVEVPINRAVSDVEKIESLLLNGTAGIDLYQSEKGSEFNIRFYHKEDPTALSDILPILENMGLRVLREEPYEIELNTLDPIETIWIHNFYVECVDSCVTDLKAVKEKFEHAFLKIWHGDLSNDKLNALVLEASLDWRQTDILRTYVRYFKQAFAAHSREFIQCTIKSYPVLSKLFVEYFVTRHDPSFKGARKKELNKLSKKIHAAFSDVDRLNEDHVLRGIFNVLENTLRTNFFQRKEDGDLKDCICLKLDSQKIDNLPLPKPYREMFVYSPDIEGVHLRGGPIARGGLRWSDRFEDYRTEVLGLMKAQMVKNSVIVPVGAKGGFVVKNPPTDGDRAAFFEEGIRCYKIFISGLLDITDNIVSGKVIPPKNVVRHDKDDPYLVVAADKGTATFSDIANAKSQEYGFWLGDAFASGGSDGYDHKKMGITAKGAWESVKRHFREIGKDIQNEDFSVVGVGDMAGDVFGNGMLLSKHIRLVGAFNHMHIFCDPDPSSSTSWKERKRLFDLPRSTWADYSADVLSKGARIYDRSAKTLDLTPQIQECFGISKKQVTPNELIRAMLRAKVELLWFGGIGTYVKAGSESHGDVGDRSNDSLRINGGDIQASIVGEGANLGFTQKGRIEYAMKGGRLNADFIDNSAGVDTSDHEVNIKILTSELIHDKKMTIRKRNNLLENMEEEVACLVLKNNYQQTQAITLSESKATSYIETHASFIRSLEKSGLLNRKVEYLPTDEEIQERVLAKKGLTRPELGILTSYSKIQITDELLSSNLVKSDYMNESWLFCYFPEVIRKKYPKYILDHQLRCQIVATELAGSMVNRMGFAFVKLKKDKTGQTTENIAKAYAVVKDICDLNSYWKRIEELDIAVPSTAQSDMLIEVTRWADRLISWLLIHGDITKDFDAILKEYQSSVAILKEKAASIMSREMLSGMNKRRKALEKQGVSNDIAKEIALLPALASSFEIIRISQRTKKPVEIVARLYYALGHRLNFDWMRKHAKRLKMEEYWQAMALTGMVDDFYACQAELTKRVITEMKSDVKKDMNEKKVIDVWAKKHEGTIGQLDEHIQMMKRGKRVNLPMLSIADQKLRTLVGI